MTVHERGARGVAWRVRLLLVFSLACSLLQSHGQAARSPAPGLFMPGVFARPCTIASVTT